MTTNLMMHGIDWDGHNVDGWLASEKFDGCRAFWTGEKLLTKSGREYRNVPADVSRALARTGVALDCEVCIPNAARKNSLGAANDAALRGVWSPFVRVIVFDLPSHGGTADERDAALRSLFDVTESDHGHRVVCCRRGTVKDADHADEWFDRILTWGGEGIMLLRPDSLYTPGRRDCLLKMK